MKTINGSRDPGSWKQQRTQARFSQVGHRARQGFTIIEMLIVIFIISILMALLFPAFQKAREGGYQASCATNLKNIGLAVAQYKQDERQYPSSLAVLLPSSKGVDSKTLKKLPASVVSIRGGTEDENQCGPDTCPNPDGTGYLNSTKNLLCPDDELDDLLRSSYGDISTSFVTPYGSANDADPAFASRVVWNYYGYKSDGTTYTDVSLDPTASGGAYRAAVNDPLRANPNRTGLTGVALQRFTDPRFNPFKSSMSNRFASANTIITHCIFHRRATSNLNAVTDLYLPGQSTDAQGARDIVLRLDGSADTENVAEWNNPATPNSQWEKQNK